MCGQSALAELHSHYPLPKGYRDYLYGAAALVRLVAHTERVARHAAALTFIILSRSRFRARTGNDEDGKVRSTGVLLLSILAEYARKRNQTLDFLKLVSIP